MARRAPTFPARTRQLTPQARGSAQPQREERVFMNPTATVLRWYRESTSRAAPQQQFTPEEVLQLLRPDAQQPAEPARSMAVRQVAAQPSAWIGRLTKQNRMEIGGLADRLPTLLFHHSSGGQPGELL